MWFVAGLVVGAVTTVVGFSLMNSCSYEDGYRRGVEDAQEANSYYLGLEKKEEN